MIENFVIEQLHVHLVSEVKILISSLIDNNIMLLFHHVSLENFVVHQHNNVVTNRP